MKQLFALFIFLTLSFLSFSQNETESNSQFNDQGKVIRLSFFIPTVEYEKRILNYTTVLASLQGGVSWGGAVGYQFSTNIRLSSRFYYGIEKRENSGKNTNKFTGNYISATLIDHSEGLFKNHIILPNINWGIQRNWGKSLFLAFDIGLLYNYKDNNTPVQPIADFKFGLAF